MNEKTQSTTAPAAEHLPEPVRRRNLTEAEWRTLKTSLFPGASNDSVLMVVDYCRARKLDPLKKPCHIVPMRVKNADGNYEWRDVVMPGIYELRTTAQRTGEYLGHSKPEYGPAIDIFGVTAPEWCEMTIYRYNALAKQRVEFPVRVYFREAAATKSDKKGQTVCNDRWNRAPVQMLTKCTEGAGLREAFPDELGGEHIAEEMDGKSYEAEPRNSIAADKTRYLDEQLGTTPEDDVREPGKEKEPADKAPPGFQEVMEGIVAAKTPDDVDAALDLARELPEGQRKKLSNMASSRRAQLQEAEQGRERA